MSNAVIYTDDAWTTAHINLNGYALSARLRITGEKGGDDALTADEATVRIINNGNATVKKLALREETDSKGKLQYVGRDDHFGGMYEVAIFATPVKGSFGWFFRVNGSVHLSLSADY